MIVLEAAVLAVVLPRLKSQPATALDISKVNIEVSRILMDPVDGYGAKSVANVDCNEGKNPPVRKNAGFNCQAIVDGIPKNIAVVFQDDAGTYAVDRPR